MTVVSYPVIDWSTTSKFGPDSSFIPENRSLIFLTHSSTCIWQGSQRDCLWPVSRPWALSSRHKVLVEAIVTLQATIWEALRPYSRLYPPEHQVNQRGCPLAVPSKIQCYGPEKPGGKHWVIVIIILLLQLSSEHYAQIVQWLQYIIDIILVDFKEWPRI